MKKIMLISALLLLAAGCNRNSATQNQSNSQDNNNSEQQQQQQQSNSQTPSKQTYANQTYGFEFTYPQDLQFVTPTYPNLEDKIVQLQTARNAYPNTNFNDAAFSVSAQYAKSLSACLALHAPESGDGFKTKVTVNGTDFYMTESTGAGAGNLYSSKAYRTLVGNQTCIELEETIHTGNIGNYPTGTVTEVDKAPIQNELDSVLYSFKFTGRQ